MLSPTWAMTAAALLLLSPLFLAGILKEKELKTK